MFKHFSTKSRKKTTAQAMVEFALVLPILLLVVYGLIETGRLIFIYASVVTASREAARYGSASGLNAAGTVPRYQDCAGIRAAAKNVGFLNTFADSDIKITYDRDLGSTAIAGVNSLPGADTCFPAGYVPQNGDRIVVQVTTQFRPMILVGTFSQFPITITTARTLLVSLPIGVAAAPGSLTGSGFVLDDPITTSSSTATPSGKTGTYFSYVGEKITYTYTLHNNGTAAISGPITLIDNRLNVAPNTTDCSGVPNPFPGGATATCTGYYYITQADLDLGSMVNQASASGGVTSNVATATITANQQPSISLTKTAPATATGGSITYTYTIQNTGNVTLPAGTSFSIVDDKIGTFACAIAASLAPGSTITLCQKPYNISPTDISRGYVTNTATASFTFNGITSTSTAQATVVTKALYLTVTPSPASASVLGTVITFNYELVNNSTSTLSGALSVTDSQVAAADMHCPANVSLSANGGTFTCYGTHTVTQADIDLGSIVDQPTATVGAQTSNQGSTFVTLTQTPALALTKGAFDTAGQPLTTATTVGVSITYTYTLQNTGNVTLTSPYTITDNKLTGVTCAAGSIAPTASINCSKTYVTTQTDLDAGSIINTASATAMFGTKTVASNQTSATVITYTSPRLKLQKTATQTSVYGFGQPINYTYTLTNTGNTALTSPTVKDDKINNNVPFTCGASIAVGATTSCTSTYTTLSTDVTAGSVTNIATAQAMAGTTPITSNSASATVTVTTPSPCDIRHSSLKTAPFAMTIFSYPSTTVTVHISSIQIYYNSSGNSITQLSFGGVNIWSGTKTGSPGVFNSPYTGDVSLSPSSNKILQVQFSSPYVPLTGGGERIIVNFAESGCPTLDSSNTSQLP